MITGEPVFDGIGTLAIGLVLLVIAVVLAREMRSLLIGESASPELERQIDAELERAPEIRRVIHTLTQHTGPDEILIAAKVEFDPGLTTPGSWSTRSTPPRRGCARSPASAPSASTSSRTSARPRRSSRPPPPQAGTSMISPISTPMIPPPISQ